LERCREKDLHLNIQKMELCKAKVTYMGHVLTDGGIQPDPEKVQGIVDMPEPSNVAELRTFLGSVNYLAQFLPNLATIANPLRSLLHKGTEFNWSSHCAEVFVKIKTLLMRAPIMSYFDISKPVTIQSDASQNGIGAALIQEGHPVAFASRSLTSTEERYAQIEKEMLAVVFACEKFDNFIYGLPSITVHSDHKPLEVILKKSINEAPRRLQRMLLRLQKYNVELQYRPGKDMWIADLLSRLFAKEEKPQSIFAVKVQNVPLDAELAISASAQQKIKDASTKDSEISEILSGKIPSRYKAVKDEIATKNGMAFKSGRLIVPVELRSEALKQLHLGHKGICSTQRLARETFFWPGITSDIQQMIAKCRVCAAFGPSQAKEPLIHHGVPDTPWQKLGMDYFEFENKAYLVTVDYYSNWIEVDPMPSMDAKSLINMCRKHFSRYGIPQEIVSDSGRQFVSRPFHDFAASLDITLTQSSPHYHQSNGKAESAVKMVKTIFKKCRMDNSDPNFALLEWRNTPMEDLNASPAQLMFNRRCRTAITRRKAALKPQVANVNNGRQRRQCKEEKRYNMHAKALRPLKHGDNVMLQIPGSTRWIQGSIIGRLKHRAYKVLCNGSVYKRNRQFLRPSALQAIEENEVPIPRCESRPGAEGATSSELRRSKRVIQPPSRYGFSA
jgi:hypothetical protein